MAYVPALSLPRWEWLRLGSRAHTRARQSGPCRAEGQQRSEEKQNIQNLVTSVKLNSRTFIAGTTISNDSSPLARAGTLMASTFASM
jgi:hypothetical protein